MDILKMSIFEILEYEFYKKSNCDHYAVKSIFIFLG